MKALTLHEPWATLIAVLAKLIETRSWAAPRSQWGSYIAIHAGNVCDRRFAASPIVREALGDAEIQKGAIVAVARLVRCTPTEQLDPWWMERAFGDYAPGRYGWLLEDIRPLAKPVSCRGWQKLWTLRPEVEAEVRRQAGLRDPPPSAAKPHGTTLRTATGATPLWSQHQDAGDNSTRHRPAES